MKLDFSDCVNAVFWFGDILLWKSFFVYLLEPPSGSSTKDPPDTTDPQSAHTSWASAYSSSSTMLEEPQTWQRNLEQDIILNKPTELVRTGPGRVLKGY